jgi:hypothetical protein
MNQESSNPAPRAVWTTICTAISEGLNLCTPWWIRKTYERAQKGTQDQIWIVL